MRKKIWILILCAALILAVGAGGNAMFGNPISKKLSQKAVERYLDMAYPGEPLSVQSIAFSSKSGCYDADIHSAVSIDTHFNVCVKPGGEIVYDTYKEAVLSKNNTANRLSDTYSDWAVPVMKLLNLRYTFDYVGAHIQVAPIEERPYETIPEFAVPREVLEIDGQYDINGLAEQAGVLEISATAETVSEENAAQMLLAIREAMDDAGIPFRAVNFTLGYPTPKDGDSVREGEIRLDYFPYEEIREAGLTECIVGNQE